MAHDSRFFAGLLTTLEAYADSFERVAATREQEEVAERFRQFVTGLPGLVMAAREQAREQLTPQQVRGAVFERDRGRER